MKQERDATGLVLLGREKSGAYLYRAPRPCSHRAARLALTHEERCRLSSLAALCRQVRPGSVLYPARLRTCFGRAQVGGTDLWLPFSGPLAARLDERTCSTIAHEFCHLDGLNHGDRSWSEREAYWSTKLFLATKGWTEWPKPGLRAPLSAERLHERAQARASLATPLSVALQERDHATEMAERWKSRAERAVNRAKKWARALARAERKVERLRAPAAVAAREERAR